MATKLSVCLCSSGCPWHQHPATVCPHSTGSNSPIWLCGSSLVSHLGFDRAPQDAQVNTWALVDQSYPWQPYLKPVGIIAVNLKDAKITNVFHATLKFNVYPEPHFCFRIVILCSDIELFNLTFTNARVMKNG